LQVSGAQHPTHHLKETNEAGLTHTVRANQHGQSRDLQLLNAFDASEPLNRDFGDAPLQAMWFVLSHHQISIFSPILAL
jgi:hypothetical protein